jgi:hypothetical protein
MANVQPMTSQQDFATLDTPYTRRVVDPGVAGGPAAPPPPPTGPVKAKEDR